MKKVFFLRNVAAIAACLAMMTACGGGSKQNAAQKGDSEKTEVVKPKGATKLITEERKTGEGSEARDSYLADSYHEEFSFAKDGALAGYKKIYTFVESADKEKALKYITFAEFTATIDGNTLVVDGNGNYLGFPYADSNFDEIKKRLDEKNVKYTVK
jgi:hypothetical protein